ncbi:hypothetical protein [Sulfurovum riftiae]|uniref:Cytochrome c domain-containing protein n=1 Tax=Sulfurovum riftiae TaxID=1630136 RepID=A0A151CEW1_9BACT|nr:hypothetical protein [Sulfurovum riftiae]KYJ85793.1 hypothetical protein AS592_03375 [Sulfurovum riftiae]
MAKIVFIFLAVFFILWGEEHTVETSLQKECLQCHIQQKIPSERIYRRYLIKYSSKALIREKIFTYLKAPTVEASIMPSPFFKKFPLKKKSELDDAALKQLVNAYIEHFDIDGKIYIVPEKSAE